MAQQAHKPRANSGLPVYTLLATNSNMLMLVCKFSVLYSLLGLAGIARSGYTITLTAISTGPEAMTNKFRVYLARVLLPIIFITAAGFPSASYAYVPEVIGGYGLPAAEIPLGGSAASLGAIDIFAAASFIAVGAAISYFTIDVLVGDHYDVVRIPLTNDPTKQIAPPTAPSTALPTGMWIAIANGVSSSGYGSTPQQACADFMSNFTFCCQLSTVTAVDSTHGYCGASFNAGGSDNPQYAQYFATTGCPAGYIAGTGAECVLDNARQAVSDHVCDFQRTGNSLAMLDDIDCQSVIQSLGLICTSTQCSVIGNGLSGKKRMVIVRNSPDGGSIISSYEEQDFEGQTVVENTNVSVGGGGAATAVDTGTSTGSIPIDGTEPQPGTPIVIDPITGEPVPTPPVDPTPEPLPPASGVAITLPTDYARQGEAADAATQISNSVSSAATQITNADDARMGDIPVGEPTIPNTNIPITFTPVDFSSAAGCPADISFSVFGSTYGISYGPLCNLMSQMRPLFLAFGALATAYIFIEGLKT